MKHKILLAGVALSLCLSCAIAAEATHWGYTGNEGPDHWGALDKASAACSAGAEQSPIDIKSAISAQLPAVSITYANSAGTIINNGHTIQVNLPAGSKLHLGDQVYDLLQFHFHAPSEHLVNGKHFPAEVHFVHRDSKGALAVIGVFLEPGGQNATFTQIAAAMPKTAGKEAPIALIDLTALLPLTKAYWSYAGSLTTPPCSETVRWTVLQTPIKVAAADLAKYTALYPMNARTPQPVNRRFVLSSP
jgi:carbonic anhydrase